MNILLSFSNQFSARGGDGRGELVSSKAIFSLAHRKIYKYRTGHRVCMCVCVGGSCAKERDKERGRERDGDKDHLVKKPKMQIHHVTTSKKSFTSGVK